jgi:hypothetical protein
MSHIICSGCSFTNFHATLDKKSNFWPEYLGEYYNVYNMGSPTNDIKTTIRSLIWKANELLENGISDITLMTCWTFLNRDSIFIPRIPTSVIHKTDYTHTDFKNGFYALSGNFFFNWMKENEDFENEKNYFSSKVKWVKTNEEDILSFLEWFYYLIVFCEAKGLKLKTFFIKDMLSIDENVFEGQIENNEVVNEPLRFDEVEPILKDLYSTKNFNKKGFNKKFEDNLYIKKFYDLIDWEKYCWFYKNDYGQYGGVYEWIYDNVEENRWVEGNDLVAGHPSPNTWKKFVNDILLKEVI